MYYVRGDRNALGTLGLWLGVLTLLWSLVPLIGVFAWLFWPVTLGLSLAGVTRCDRHIANNRSQALAGVVISTLAGVICCAWLAFSLIGP